MLCQMTDRKTLKSERPHSLSSVISLHLDLELQKNSFSSRFTPTLSPSCCT